MDELKQAKVGEGTANLDAENHYAFILRQSDSDRYQSDLKSTRDLLDTLKKTIHQLGQSQTELASQLGQTTNRSVAELDRSREQWEQDKKEMTTAIARLERDLSVKLSETSSVSKKVADLEVHY